MPEEKTEGQGSYDVKEVGKIKGVKPSFPWERTRITDREPEPEPEEVIPEAEPTSVPEIWKQFKALRDRVEKIEKIPFIGWFLR